MYRCVFQFFSPKLVTCTGLSNLPNNSKLQRPWDRQAYRQTYGLKRFLRQGSLIKGYKRYDLPKQEIEKYGKFTVLKAKNVY